ncbi:hypothetical protein [Anaeromyxobacter sp. SG66]|uniref:hypothetical protein n=1 Tax=Anaeromyxobacter sp. SG66 TaxID=2925410 RepID=UPI001F56D2AE|nr:hypothetical protein [Anaeromyxobacter sp. SG66]
MLNRFAHALLVSTSLAPVALVYGLSFLPASPRAAVPWLVGAAGLTAACILVLKVATARGERIQLPPTERRNVDKDVLAFLVSYALPLVAPSQGGAATFAFWGFIALVAIVLYQSEMVHVNPLLGMLGYRFYEVPRERGDAALLIAKSGVRANRASTVIRLSDTLWLEVP